MSQNDSGLLFLMWIGTVILSIYSGFLAWDWVQPASFFGAIGFLIVWAIFARIAHFLMFGVLLLLFKN